MADPNRAQEAPRSAERIVDIVFAGEPTGRARRFAIGFGAVLAALGGVGLVAARMGPSAGPWSAEMAARVHDAIAAERAVDLTPPAPPQIVPPSVPEPSAPRVAHLRVKGPASPPSARPAPAAPAQAGALAAVADSPVDFTGTAFVVGSSATYAGGTTMRSGTSRTAVAGTVAPGATGNGAASGGSKLARPVSLDQAAWACNNGDNWPSEAEALQIDEQFVVVRVTVRADGRPEHVEVVIDPGFGFGAAARKCAFATRFEPARDAAGNPTAATSPPIRVHFFR